MDNIRDNRPTLTATRQRMYRSATYIALSQVHGLFGETEKSFVCNYLFESLAKELLHRNPDINLTKLTPEVSRQVTTVIQWLIQQAVNAHPILESMVNIRIGVHSPMCNVYCSLAWSLTATLINDINAIRSYVDFERSKGQAQ